MTDQERIKRLAEWMGWHVEQWADGEWICSSAGKITEVHHWNPLKKIGDAWMLVEKARKDSWWLSLAQYPSKAGPWRASFSFGGMAVSHEPRFRSEEPTAPLAICRAVERLMEGKP